MHGIKKRRFSGSRRSTH